jgi:CheY-like chemotaxis protein
MHLLHDVHVLVVDDEVEVRDVIAEILRLSGATVSCAGSGEEAVALLGTCKPDVIVTDLAMINGSGFWLLREVKKRMSLTTPVIAISGHFEEAERERLLASGFDFLVAKPLQFDEFLQTVARSTGR